MCVCVCVCVCNGIEICVPIYLIYVTVHTHARTHTHTAHFKLVYYIAQPKCGSRELQSITSSHPLHDTHTFFLICDHAIAKPISIAIYSGSSTTIRVYYGFTASVLAFYSLVNRQVKREGWNRRHPITFSDV